MNRRARRRRDGDDGEAGGATAHGCQAGQGFAAVFAAGLLGIGLVFRGHGQGGEGCKRIVELLRFRECDGDKDGVRRLAGGNGQAGFALFAAARLPAASSGTRYDFPHWGHEKAIATVDSGKAFCLAVIMVRPRGILQELYSGWMLKRFGDTWT